jgi:hypothetical protein
MWVALENSSAKLVVSRNRTFWRVTLIVVVAWRSCTALVSTSEVKLRWARPVAGVATGLWLSYYTWLLASRSSRPSSCHLFEGRQNWYLRRNREGIRGPGGK